MNPAASRFLPAEYFSARAASSSTGNSAVTAAKIGPAPEVVEAIKQHAIPLEKNYETLVTLMRRIGGLKEEQTRLRDAPLAMTAEVRSTEELRRDRDGLTSKQTKLRKEIADLNRQIIHLEKSELPKASRSLEEAKNFFREKKSGVEFTQKEIQRLETSVEAQLRVQIEPLRARQNLLKSELAQIDYQKSAISARQFQWNKDISKLVSSRKPKIDAKVVSSVFEVPSFNDQTEKAVALLGYIREMTTLVKKSYLQQIEELDTAVELSGNAVADMAVFGKKVFRYTAPLMIGAMAVSISAGEMENQELRKNALLFAVLTCVLPAMWSAYEITKRSRRKHVIKVERDRALQKMNPSDKAERAMNSPYDSEKELYQFATSVVNSYSPNFILNTLNHIRKQVLGIATEDIKETRKLSSFPQVDAEISKDITTSLFELVKSESVGRKGRGKEVAEDSAERVFDEIYSLIRNKKDKLLTGAHEVVEDIATQIFKKIYTDNGVIKLIDEYEKLTAKLKELDSPRNELNENIHNIGKEITEHVRAIEEGNTTEEKKKTLSNLNAANLKAERKFDEAKTKKEDVESLLKDNRQCLKEKEILLYGTNFELKNTSDELKEKLAEESDQRTEKLSQKKTLVETIETDIRIEERKLAKLVSEESRLIKELATHKSALRNDMLKIATPFAIDRIVKHKLQQTKTQLSSHADETYMAGSMFSSVGHCLHSLAKASEMYQEYASNLARENGGKLPSVTEDYNPYRDLHFDMEREIGYGIRKSGREDTSTILCVSFDPLNGLITHAYPYLDSFLEPALPEYEGAALGQIMR